VHDLAAAKDFYTELLGFDIVQDLDDRVRFRCGSFEFVAFQGDRLAAASEHGVDSSSAIVFPVDDIDATIKTMKARGVRFIHETPGSNDLGRYAAFCDPSGIVHELLQPPN
jgi:glyoxylase I family protein